MKLRIDSTNGQWSVFVEELKGSGIYKKLDPTSDGISHIDVDTEPPKGGSLVSFVTNEKSDGCSS